MPTPANKNNNFLETAKQNIVSTVLSAGSAFLGAKLGGAKSSNPSNPGSVSTTPQTPPSQAPKPNVDPQTPPQTKVNPSGEAPNTNTAAAQQLEQLYRNQSGNHVTETQANLERIYNTSDYSPKAQPGEVIHLGPESANPGTRIQNPAADYAQRTNDAALQERRDARQRTNDVNSGKKSIEQAEAEANRAGGYNPSYGKGGNGGGGRVETGGGWGRSGGTIKGGGPGGTTGGPGGFAEPGGGVSPGGAAVTAAAETVVVTTGGGEVVGAAAGASRLGPVGLLLIPASLIWAHNFQELYHLWKLNQRVIPSMEIKSTRSNTITQSTGISLAVTRSK